MSSGLSVIPSVYPSYAGIVILYRNDCTDLAGCGMDAFSTSVIRKFEYFKKQWYFFETLSQTLDLRVGHTYPWLDGRC